MARVRLVWVWLVAVSLMIAGCGGDDDTPPPPQDAASDVRTDARTDAATDARPDTADARADADAPAPTIDVRQDTPAPTPDVTPDRGPDMGAPDVRPDVTPDVAPDVPRDVTPDVVPETGGCTADAQCPASAPHCNTTSGACVSRTSINVTPANESIAAGTTQQFQATVIYSDNSTGNVTAQATWSSSNTGFATINAAGLATGVATGLTTISAALGGITGTTTLNVTNATLLTITVTPPNPTSPRGTTQQFTATGNYSDNSTQDLSATAVWSSGTTTVATISNAGLATAVDVGSSVITATVGAVSGTATITVTSATLSSLAVTPPNPTIARLTTRQFTATGTYTDNTTRDVTAEVTWSSSNQAAANISNTAGSQGLALGAGAGVTTITATSGAVTGSTVLTVTGATLQSIAVSPANPTRARGLAAPFTATGTYDDATTQDLTTLVTWTSSDTAVAVISNTAGSQGLASTVNPGTTTITATLGVVSGTSLFTVTAETLVSIELTPPTPTIAMGTDQQFVAVGTYTDNTTQTITTAVTWTSSDAAVAPISNAAGTEGLANGLNAGTATITARLGTVTQSTVLRVTAATLRTIAVTPTNPTIAKGNSRQFTATGTYTDNSIQDLTTAVTWNSGDVAVATISSAAGSEGLANGAGVGSVTITASLGAVSGITQLTVTAATLVSIQVAPPAPSIPRGTTQQFTATGTYSDSTTQDLTELASWSSSNGTFATVSNAAGTRGLATGKNVGTPTITAHYTGVSGSTTLNVTAATLTTITVTPANQTIAAGTELQFQATGTYTDLSTQNLTTLVTWSSEAPAIASISNTNPTRGVARGLTQGETTIRATLGTVVGQTALTVAAPQLDSVEVTPTNPTIAAGTTEQFTATAHYSDGTTSNVTTSAIWTSSASNFATVSNAAGSEGLATGVAAGTTTITATFDGVSGNTPLNVNAAALVTIAVTPANQSIANGTSLQYVAIGTYSNGSTQNLTNSATWSSTAGAVASVSNAAATRGRATGLTVGATEIRATFGTIFGGTPLTVTAATLTSITIAPSAQSIARGTTHQFTATGNYSNSTTQDLTTQVTWSSSNTAIATISNTDGTRGLATGDTAGGPITITATFGAVSGTASLTVTAATLQTITVTPVNGTTTPNTTRQFTATGSYSNATTQDITALVTWDSSSPAVATISNAAGSKGLATAVTAGTTVISAQMATTGAPITGTTNLTVAP